LPKSELENGKLPAAGGEGVEKREAWTENKKDLAKTKKKHGDGNRRAIVNGPPAEYF